MVVPVWRVAVMQGRLRHDDRPGWFFLEDGFESAQQVLKARISMALTTTSSMWACA